MTHHHFDSTNRGYKASDIATPAHELLCWCEGAAIHDTLQAALNYKITYVPVRKRTDAPISGVVTVDSLASAEPTVQPLTSDWLIAADTPILHVIELFAENADRVFFILQSSKIMGLVAPADLNKIPSRATLYLLIAGFEHQLVDLIKHCFPNPDDYLRHLSAERLEKLYQEQQNAQSQDVNLSLVDALYLNDLITIVKNEERLYSIFGFTSESSKNQMKSELFFTDIRNSVSHPTRLLLTSRSKLTELSDKCQRLMRYTDLMKEARQSLR